MWLSVGQVARELGISYSTVLRRLKAGDLRGWQLYTGGAWRIESSELIEYVSDRLDIYPDALLGDLEERYRGL